jgi:hypothetical protein
LNEYHFYGKAADSQFLKAMWKMWKIFFQKSGFTKLLGQKIAQLNEIDLLQRKPHAASSR